MKRFSLVFAWLLACAAACIVPASAKSPACSVKPFQGASLPQGAVAQMRIVNTGQACVISSYRLPAEHANPADSGRITRQPGHGKAEFAAPHAKYTPEAGYVGKDEFEFEAFARGRSNQNVRLKVQVQVQVVAP